MQQKKAPVITGAFLTIFIDLTNYLNLVRL